MGCDGTKRGVALSRGRPLCRNAKRRRDFRVGLPWEVRVGGVALPASSDHQRNVLRKALGDAEAHAYVILKHCRILALARFGRQRHRSSTISSCVPVEIATERCLVAAPDGMKRPSPALNEMTFPSKLMLKSPFNT